MAGIARNKHPEITVKRILDASFQLFLVKGYEHTTIQDIVNNLGDLSKGAIYHHFKSKEDIIEKVAENITAGMDDRVYQYRDSKIGTALERLRNLILDSLKNPVQTTLLAAAPDLMKTPRFLTRLFEATMSELCPNIFEPMIEQGIKDGSLTCTQPKIASEMIGMLLCFWLNPAIFAYSREGLHERYAFLQRTLEDMGVPLLDDEIEGCFMQYRDLLEAQRKTE